MGSFPLRRILVFLLASLIFASFGHRAKADDAHANGEYLVTDNPPGKLGGRIVVSLRSEPKTLNPVLATDDTSRNVIQCLTADLIHINRGSQKTEPALAKSWTVSRDGRQYTLRLRQGLQFSNGHPVDADDVLFTFHVYLDENVDSPQRDLLIVGGKPIQVDKIDSHTVRFELAQPYAAAERLFDGLAILPRHLLEAAYRQGKFAEALKISTSPTQFAGLGPFRLKEYVAGQRIVLERNPYYWKQDRQGTRLPYVDELVFLFVLSEDAQVIRFQSGDTDMLSRFGADDFAVLEKQQASKGYHVYDLGPGLEYNFLFFNLNDINPKDLPEVSRKQDWFQDMRFRQAISSAIDRDGIIHLVYHGRATPLWGHVSPGNKLWIDSRLSHPAKSIDHAKQLLQTAGFSWKGGDALVDNRGNPVEFSILVSSSNAERVKMATIIQEDLSQLGMNVHVVSLEFGAVVNRLLKTHDYEACIMGLVDGDADPTPEMNIWLSSGESHLWHPQENHPATAWEAQMDDLMEQQLTTLDYAKRKSLFDRLQEIVAEDLPIICLASPNILVAAKNRVQNFHPAVMDPYTLWNVEQLYLQ
jgi:peptide/nickel transport system substrate-binding protein